jgi:hypothetical protein
VTSIAPIAKVQIVGGAAVDRDPVKVIGKLKAIGIARGSDIAKAIVPSGLIARATRSRGTIDRRRRAKSDPPTPTTILHSSKTLTRADSRNSKSK